MNPISLCRTVIDRAARFAAWIGQRLRDLWKAHTESLETSAAYRKQVLVLSGAVLTLLAVAGPLDAVLAASVATYVAAHVVDEERSDWNHRPAVITRSAYDYDYDRPW